MRIARAAAQSIDAAMRRGSEKKVARMFDRRDVAARQQLLDGIVRRVFRVAAVAEAMRKRLHELAVKR
jgi:hypothetical protein